MLCWCVMLSVYMAFVFTCEIVSVYCLKIKRQEAMTCTIAMYSASCDCMPYKGICTHTRANIHAGGRVCVCVCVSNKLVLLHMTVHGQCTANARTVHVTVHVQCTATFLC